jgi:hypothetical protein
MEQQALSDVLFALVAARDHAMSGLNRTALQRLLFLAAAVYPLTGDNWGYGFSTARFGPFNTLVNQAADQLALRGLCEFKEFGVNTDGNIRAVYRVTDIGVAQVQRITKIHSQQRRCEWINTVTAALDIYGSSVISKIASKEPSYVEMRARNQIGGIPLGEADNKSIALIERLATDLKKRFKVDTESLMEKLLLYFDFLSSGLLESR